MSSEHLVFTATQSMTIQHFSPSMPSSPPTRGATPSSIIPIPLPPLSPFPASPQSLNGSNLHYSQPLMSLSTVVNGAAQQQENTTPTSIVDLSAEIDPQIIEALKSKDRIFVLKCGEMMESLIREPSKMRAEVVAATSYQRMLVHRCSTFYKMTLEVDPVTKIFSITLTDESRIPGRKISDLVPAEPTPQPAIKIMQRTPRDRKPKSQTNSVAGDDPDLSDAEPSETGSLGGGHTKKRPTIEEREAAYKEARSRIFTGFEEKEKGNMNSSSSSLSLTSSSAGAGSSTGDLDDASSPATESEWSPSNTREGKKEFRRGSGASNSRNGRSNFSGPTSVRNSRASSPSFKFASIYDSSQTNPYYDPHAPYPEQPLNTGYHPPQYSAPYPPPTVHPSNIPPPFPYYHPYNPYQPPQHQPHPIDGLPPTNGDMYHGPGGPGNPFTWQNPPFPPPHIQSPQPPLHSQPNPNQLMNTAPPPGQGPHYMPYHVPPYPYPTPSYYPPPGQMVPPYPNPAPTPMYDMSRPPNGTIGSGYGPVNPGRPGVSNGANIPANNGRNVRNSSGPNMNGASKGRPGPSVPPPRPGWNYGLGGGMGGYAAPPPPPSSGDVVGPRLSSSRRSGNASRSSSINDEVSSTASSSTTSSSSRRVQSATSSQHPLPARPDWAVAMTMGPSNQPYGRHHHHDHTPRSAPATRNSSGTSGPGNISLSPSAPPPMPPLHPMDFPPLTPAPAPERRPPNAMGAWGNFNIRSTLMPNQGQQLSPVKPYPNLANNSQPHNFDDSDRSFDRPPPKSAELYNHKSGKRASTSNAIANGRVQIENEIDPRKNDALSEQMGTISIADQGPPGTIANGASQDASLTLSVSLKVGT